MGGRRRRLRHFRIAWRLAACPRHFVVKPSSRMPRRLISTGSPFEKTAGYSRAVVDGDFCFVAGTTGYDYATMAMPDAIEEQTRNCFRTIARALGDAGFALADAVRD